MAVANEHRMHTLDANGGYAFYRIGARRNAAPRPGTDNRETGQSLAMENGHPVLPGMTPLSPAVTVNRVVNSRSSCGPS